MPSRRSRSGSGQNQSPPAREIGLQTFLPTRPTRSASQRIPVTAIRADYEFAKAFYTPTAPRPRLGILRRLERRCSGRHFFHSHCADRNGTRTRSTSNRKPSRQAEKEECIAHGYLLRSPRRQRRCFPFVPHVAARRASNPVGVARRTHLAAPKSGPVLRRQPRFAGGRQGALVQGQVKNNFPYEGIGFHSPWLADFNLEAYGFAPANGYGADSFRPPPRTLMAGLRSQPARSSTA